LVEGFVLFQVLSFDLDPPFSVDEKRLDRVEIGLIDQSIIGKSLVVYQRRLLEKMTDQADTVENEENLKMLRFVGQRKLR
jgi:hypothetical protein